MNTWSSKQCISHTAKIDRKKANQKTLFNLGATSGKRTGRTIWVLLLGPVNEKFEPFYHMSPTAVCSRFSFIVGLPFIFSDLVWWLVSWCCFNLFFSSRDKPKNCFSQLPLSYRPNCPLITLIGWHVGFCSRSGSFLTFY